MDHSEALQRKAAERYLLGELTGVERQEYEEHFFSCGECAQEIGLGVAFIENARDIFADEAAPASVEPAVAPAPTPADVEKQPRQNWLAGWLRPSFAAPAFAAVVLLIVIAYQNAVQIPHLNEELSRANQPRALADVHLLPDTVHGAASPVEVSAKQKQSLSLSFDIPPDSSFASYRCEIQDASGATEFSLPVTAEEATSTIHWLVSPSRLQPGKHVLVVRGLASSEGPAGPIVGRYPFVVNFSN